MVVLPGGSLAGTGIVWRLAGGSPKRNGGASWVAVAGVSGGGGDPRRPAVVLVDVIRDGGGQYCWWNWGNGLAAPPEGVCASGSGVGG